LGRKEFVYHLVPDGGMRGGTLYPLNYLREIHPDLAAWHLRKYVGRKDTPAQQVPPLDCTRGDVILFSPVPPAAIRAAMTAAGHTCLLPRRWYEIDVSHFHPSDTALYLPGDSLTKARFLPYEPGCLASYRAVAETQKRIYRAVIPGGYIPLFSGCPQLLYRGAVPLPWNVRVITV